MNVRENGAAAKAGLKEGDLITKLNGIQLIPDLNWLDKLPFIVRVIKSKSPIKEVARNMK